MYLPALITVISKFSDSLWAVDAAKELELVLGGSVARMVLVAAEELDWALKGVMDAEGVEEVAP